MVLSSHQHQSIGEHWYESAVATGGQRSLLADGRSCRQCPVHHEESSGAQKTVRRSNHDKDMPNRPKRGHRDRLGMRCA